jgi:hypothetical protein
LRVEHASTKINGIYPGWPGAQLATSPPPGRFACSSVCRGGCANWGALIRCSRATGAAQLGAAAAARSAQPAARGYCLCTASCTPASATPAATAKRTTPQPPQFVAASGTRYQQVGASGNSECTCCGPSGPLPSVCCENPELRVGEQGAPSTELVCICITRPV